jgi:cell division protein FtsZ
LKELVGKLRNDGHRMAKRTECPARPPQSERPQQRPTVRHPEARPATPISEYARKAAPQGRSSPGHNLIEEDVLDIPAFLRRKAI